MFQDTDVSNGEEYCYKVMSVGSYGIRRIPDILLNFSQISCAVPIDTVPPCRTNLRVRNLCDDNTSINSQDFVNRLSWTPVSNCANIIGVATYNIYYAEFDGSEFQFLENVDGLETNYEHRPESGISGCYAMTSLDVLGNESTFSNVICLDNCPLYELPNTFTPNGDQSNDLFAPRINRFIDHIEMDIYNKWGQIVFSTDDPQINWDGTASNGRELAAGSYYYTARIFERRLSGIFEQDQVLVGYINLIR
jgi:gliding motility-associated-like protein